ncbi:MAG: D-ribose high-affinity transport system [Clostridia bacterium]|jgi:ribose/xylose/arabinose/galactoside ABC-type transport system permease subunit|nr:D-ribose high-affinity transport system [Clostridia bacterium]
MKKQNKLVIMLKSREFILGLFTLIFFIILFATTNFKTAAGLQAYFRDIAYILVASIAMTILFLTGNTDLSMGTTMGLAGYFAAYVAKLGFEWYIFIPVAIITGLIFAGINGVIVTVFKVPAMVASLALMTIHMGLFTLLPAGGWVENMGPNFTLMGSTNMLTYFPVVFIIALLVFIISVIYMKSSRFSKKIYAVGGNAHASTLAGINPDKTVFITYLIAGALVGIAAVLFYTNKQMVQANSSYGMEMMFITTTVVGGTSVAGGKGNLWGTFVGTFLVALLTRAMIFFGLQDYYSYAFQGVIIIIAVLASAINFSSISKKLFGNNKEVVCCGGNTNEK